MVGGFFNTFEGMCVCVCVSVNICPILFKGSMEASKTKYILKKRLLMKIA